MWLGVWVSALLLISGADLRVSGDVVVRTQRWNGGCGEVCGVSCDDAVGATTLGGGGLEGVFVVIPAPVEGAQCIGFVCGDDTRLRQDAAEVKFPGLARKPWPA